MSIEAEIQSEDKNAREAQAKVDALDAAVFDLKAVNPNAIVEIDTRTPDEVIENIANEGQKVVRALKSLMTLFEYRTLEKSSS